VDKQTVPPEVWIEVYQLQSALADLTRALVHNDDTYLVGDLGKLAWHRARLVNLCQSWRPELRIAAEVIE
jgi:hypothetical protein